MRFLLTLSILLPMVLSCKTSSVNVRSDLKSQDQNQHTSSLFPAIDASLLPAASEMNKAYFQKSYSHLSEEEFDAKWQASLVSPILFFRSYVNTWYNEIDRLKNLGQVGPCFGDPHPENFGFLWYGAEDFRYLYNDMDDVGSCPVAFDALRYFTALKLYMGDKNFEDTIQSAYLDALNGKDKLDKSSIIKYLPTLVKLEEKNAGKSLDGDKIKLTEETVAITDAEKHEIYSAVNVGLAQSGQRSMTMLDAVKVVVKSGGSGGLDRYLILFLDQNGHQQLVELKELTKPATALGHWSPEKLTPRSTIANLAWNGSIPRFFAFTQLKGADVTLRSRTKSAPKLEDLTTEEKLKLFQYQVRLMARLHALTLKDPEHFSEWLNKQSQFTVDRYRTAYNLAKSTGQ